MGRRVAPAYGGVGNMGDCPHPFDRLRVGPTLSQGGEFCVTAEWAVHPT